MVSVGIYVGGWEQELILQGPLQLVRVTTNQTLDRPRETVTSGVIVMIPSRLQPEAEPPALQPLTALPGKKWR